MMRDGTTLAGEQHRQTVRSVVTRNENEVGTETLSQRRPSESGVMCFAIFPSPGHLYFCALERVPGISPYRTFNSPNVARR
jgi:hypothetical protein